MRVRGLSIVGLMLLSARPASATWSVIAIDVDSKTIVASAASCVTQKMVRSYHVDSLYELTAIVVPGIGGAIEQAHVDHERASQGHIREALLRRMEPDKIVRMLHLKDPMIQARQVGIVDADGRTVAFTGARDHEHAADRHGLVPGTRIAYSIQGDFLKDATAIDVASTAFEATQGSLADRVLAAMQATAAKGGDRRCQCESFTGTCTPKSARIAYLAEVLKTDAPPKYSTYIAVTDETLRSDEDPVQALTLKYKALRPSSIPRP
jgi:hypothetical protein